MRSIISLNFLLLALFLFLGSKPSSAQTDFEEKEEEELAFEDLPEAVKESHHSSSYQDLERKEVEKIVTEEGEVYFEIEVHDQDGKVRELYYSRSGSLAHNVLEEEEDDEEDEEEEDDEDE